MDKKILYYSTNRVSPPVSFPEALIQGQAPDRGLYLPDEIPALREEEIDEFRSLPYSRIAYQVLRRFLRDEISDAELERISEAAYGFPVPLEPVRDNTYIMRLDQGPTASFKDFAARMMGRLMAHFLSREQKRLVIITATSGDTGSAIANAFHGLENIEVVVLFPRLEVSDRQRKQMTTLGGNVRVIAWDGKFDDCQALAKEAFADPKLAGMSLSSANSINIGRLIPQAVYYMFAYARLRKTREEKILFSVPCGNFGDLMGGLIARAMGVKSERFIIATNENDEVPRFLAEGRYEKIVPSKNCISSAMNVGHPSNLARIVSLYGGWMDHQGVLLEPPDLERMRREFFAISIGEKSTRETIRRMFQQYGIWLEPHGAVGWAGLEAYAEQFGIPAGLPAVSLETAHPAKFPEQIREILHQEPPLPPSLAGLEEKEEHIDPLEGGYPAFRSYLLDRFG